MEKRRALGRGLEALIPAPAVASKESQQVVNINVREIKPNRYQPRQDFVPELMQELKLSIKEKGFIQPILVRRLPEGYELIAGERRWRAAKELEITQVPAIIKDIKDDADLLEVALIENLQREELNPIEEARAFKRLIEDFGLNTEKVGRIAGKESVSVVNTLRLLKLPAEVQESISQNRLSEGHGRAILSLDSPQKQIAFAEYVIKNGLSVRETERQAKKLSRKKTLRTASARKKETQLIAWEESLQRALGTRVRILPRRGRGKIELEYYSSADLERLVRLLEK